MRHVDIGGMRHGDREAGSGTPLVFLHGILGDSRYWQPQLAGLEGTSRAIAWDAPGVGGSEDPEPFFGVEGYVEALAGFLDFVDDAPAPDRVASLVLADTYAGWRGSLSEGEYQARRAAALEQLDIGGVPDDIPGVMHPRARPEARSTIDRMIADARPGGLRSHGSGDARHRLE